MRFLGFAALMALAACGGQAENKSKGAATALQPGQYEVVAEVTRFEAADEGEPKMNTPQGTRTTRSVCVPAGGQLPPELFTDEGMSCERGSSDYVRAGIINATARCTREGWAGEVAYSVNGSFAEDSFEAERQLRTALSGDGDVVIRSNLTGRRTGECTAAPADGNSTAPANGS